MLAVQRRFDAAGVEVERCLQMVNAINSEILPTINNIRPKFTSSPRCPYSSTNQPYKEDIPDLEAVEESYDEVTIN